MQILYANLNFNQSSKKVIIMIQVEVKPERKKTLSKKFIDLLAEKKDLIVELEILNKDIDAKTTIKEVFVKLEQNIKELKFFFKSSVNYDFETTDHQKFYNMWKSYMEDNRSFSNLISCIDELIKNAPVYSNVSAALLYWNEERGMLDPQEETLKSVFLETLLEIKGRIDNINKYEYKLTQQKQEIEKEIDEFKQLCAIESHDHIDEKKYPNHNSLTFAQEESKKRKTNQIAAKFQQLSI